MSQSICAESKIQNFENELKLEDNVNLDSGDANNVKIEENKQTMNENADKTDSPSQVSVLENSSRTLSFQHEPGSNNIKSDEEFLTDSEDYNYKRNTDVEITVDDTDFSECSDEEKVKSPKASNIEDADKTLTASYSGDSIEKTVSIESFNKMETAVTSTPGSSFPLSNDCIIGDDDIIESSDNMETFINFCKKTTTLPTVNEEKIEVSELEEDADLFSSQEENWYSENSTLKEKEDEKLFTHKESVQTMLKHCCKTNEKLDCGIQKEEDGFLGFSKNEFSCNIKLCPTKREKDVAEYFNKCEKEIEKLSQYCLDAQKNIKVKPVTKDKNNVKKNVDISEKPNPLREIVKNIEKHGIRKYDDIEEDFLGFASTDVDCNNPLCKAKNKNTKNVLKNKLNYDIFRRAKDIIFKEPNPKNPKVVVEDVFSLFE